MARIDQQYAGNCLDDAQEPRKWKLGEKRTALRMRSPNKDIKRRRHSPENDVKISTITHNNGEYLRKR